MKRMHCDVAYDYGLAEFRYDPKRFRIVFLCRDSKGEIVDAIGRSLSREYTPKWLRYGNSDVPFICFSKESRSTAVVVEDAASACAVGGAGWAGIALLGTNLQDSFIGAIKEFDKVIVCLDRDAAVKGLDLQRELSFYVNTSIIIPDDDLKYYDYDEIKEIIGE